MYAADTCVVLGAMVLRVPMVRTCNLGKLIAVRKEVLWLRSAEVEAGHFSFVFVKCGVHVPLAAHPTVVNKEFT